jgi:uncharacterized protein (TIGR02271 family)
MTDERTTDPDTRADAGAPAGDAGQEAGILRSEERLDVVAHVQEVGRVRISKRVVTEERVVTLQVRREELVVEELPVDPGRGDDPLVMAHSELSGAARTAPPVVEMWLSEEQVELTTRVVPRERVRVFVDTVTELVEVGGTVAREVVEVDELGTTH